MESALLEPLLQASFGGFMLNMMNLFEDSKKPKNRRTTKDGLYWVFFVFWPIAGAGLAYIFISSGYHIDGLLAFTTGLTAPMVVQTMMKKFGSPNLDSIDANVEQDID